MSRFIGNDELRSVNPAILGLMLLASGWREPSVSGRAFRVLESPGAETDVAIPLNRTFRDYPVRLNEALAEVERYLGDRARPFMLQLVSGPMDEVLFAEDSPTVHGSIPWGLGEELHDNAREAFRAVAKSSDQHLPQFGKKGYKHAKRFMDRVRMGQTGQGSYIVTALVPLAEEDEQLGLFPGIESTPRLEGNFFRKVTTNLMQATSAAVSAAEEVGNSDSVAPFVEAVDYGVSAELVEALSNIARGQEIEISARWSPLAGEPAYVPSSVTITPSHVPALQVATTNFKDRSAVTKVTVTGIVTGLDRPRFGQEGISRLDVISGIDARRLRVRLSRDQYEAAIEAHRVGDRLQMTGELSRAGNLFWLYNVRNIQIVPGPPQLFNASRT